MSTPLQPPPAPLAQAAPLQAELYAVVDVQSGSPDEQLEPLPSAGASLIESIPESEGHNAPCVPVPLVPARRMAAFLRRCLRHRGPSQRLDVGRWVELVARGSFPARLPTQRLAGWQHRSAIAFDGDERGQAQWADMHALAAHAMRLAGGQVTVLWCDTRGSWWQARPAAGGTRWQAVAAPAPLSYRHWLMVGACDPAPRIALWRKLAAGALEAGGTACWLQPRLQVSASQAWQTAMAAAAWDQGVDLRLRRPCLNASAEGLPAASLGPLLASLSLAVRFEPALLRAVRQGLGLPIDVEAAVWGHADVDSSSLACQIKPARVGVYRHLLRTQALAWRQALAGLIASLHGHLSPLIRMEEASLAADLAPGAAAAGLDPWRAVARTLDLAPSTPAGEALARYVRRLGARAHPGLWAASPALAEAWVRAETPAIHEGAALPEGLPPAMVRTVLARSSRAVALENWQLVQHGNTLLLQREGAGARQRWLGSFGPFRPEAGITVTSAAGERWTELSPYGTAVAGLAGPGPWKLAAGMTSVTVARLERPAWAQAWAFDGNDVVVTTPPLGHRGVALRVDTSHTLDPQHPLLPRGYDTHLFEPNPSLAPGWRLGTDRRFGLFAELRTGAVTQRFRWLPPGEFQMGSPEDEPGRYDGESPRHRVRISRGFWLADTACTVALWDTVIAQRPGASGEHPDLPETNVSFDEVQTFLQRLQALLPAGCSAGLPTEAEWEYACRAGTETAFHLGARITSAQANFDASEPSELAEPGPQSPGPVTVKSRPPNDWGLFEMHGNVWEWCSDAMRSYQEGAAAGEPLVDPSGPAGPETAHRAVRGGSWFHRARFLRSAYRGEGERGYRYHYLGFRVALRSTGPAAPEGPQEPGIRPVPEAQGPARRDAGPARTWADRFRDAFKPSPSKRGGKR